MNEKTKIKSIRMSVKPVLPSLRPLSPAIPSDTPRGIRPPSKLTNSLHRYSSDFEVNRSLFNPAPRPKGKSILLPLEVLKNDDDVEKNNIDNEITNINDNNNINKSDNNDHMSYKPSDILLLEDLIKRIPNIDPKSNDFDFNDVYKISPILDRILCVTISWRKEEVANFSKYDVIDTIKTKLYMLVDIDDFLLRTIVCKILLCFAPDSSSPLLLPVSAIFYKLSCDQTNDPFFVEENLDEVLIKLIENSPIEAKVYAAAAIKNICSHEVLRERFVKSNLLSLANEIFSDDQSDETLKLQIICSLKQLTKSSAFNEKLAESNILSLAAKDNILFNEVLRICSLVPSLSENEKLLILNYLMTKNLTEESDLIIAAKSFMNISKNIENTIECTKTALFIIHNSLNNQQVLLPTIDILSKCCQISGNAHLVESDNTVYDLLKNEDLDISIRYSVLSLISTFTSEMSKKLYNEYKDQLEVEM